MKDIHMNPAEAVQAHLDLEARRSLSMHFGCFHVTAVGIDEPVRDLADALLAREVPAGQFRTLAVAELIWLAGGT
jgi:L-ascorbate metabolism protein UlaG (beta-lactamase superfamily)